VRQRGRWGYVSWVGSDLLGSCWSAGPRRSGTWKTVRSVVPAGIPLCPAGPAASVRAASASIAGPVVAETAAVAATGFPPGGLLGRLCVLLGLLGWLCVLLRLLGRLSVLLRLLGWLSVLLGCRLLGRLLLAAGCCIPCVDCSLNCDDWCCGDWRRGDWCCWDCGC